MAEVATSDEVLAGLADYTERCNANAALRKMLRRWSQVCQFRATDTGDTFTVRIEAGEIVEAVAGTGAEPGLIISATSEDLADMFWGDLNPAQKYMTGEIAVQGSQEDVLRVDAMAAVIWADA